MNPVAINPNQSTVTENNRFLKLLTESGISEGIINVSRTIIEGMLNDKHLIKMNSSAKLAAELIYDANRWFDKGHIFIIHGNDWRGRALFGDVMLCRYAYRVRSGVSLGIKKIKMSEILIKLSSFDDDRQKFSRELSEIPCLLIKEPSMEDIPRQLNEAVTMLNLILEARIEHKLTTIITMPSGKFTPDKLGSRFSEIILGKIKRFLILIKNDPIETDLFNRDLTEDDKMKAFKDTQVERMFNQEKWDVDTNLEHQWEDEHYHPGFIKWKYNRISRYSKDYQGYRNSLKKERELVEEEKLLHVEADTKEEELF